MLNKIWGIFIIIAISYGFFSGNIEYVNNSLFESIQTTTNFVITLAGNICFWTGIMKIVSNTSILSKIKKIINPLIHCIFPEISKDTECYNNISMNMVSNIIGLGNAATPCGLKAMEELQKENKNKDKLSNSMIKFMLINTASIQLIPTTIIAIRTSLGSQKPSSIIFGIWFASFMSFISIIIISKIYIRFFRK
ncbi:MAG: nucleoside recognition domain-containing protein [Candidatus Scatovivens sp.]